MVDAFRAPVVCEPVIPLFPVQPPTATQLVALLLLQLSIVAPPLVTDPRALDRLTVGAGFGAGTGTGAGTGVTVTDTLRLTVPPAPTQARVKPVVLLSDAVFWIPVSALLPVQPPDAVQVVVLALFQVSVAPLPATTEPALALRESVGTGAGVGVGGGVGVGAGAGAGAGVTVTETLRLALPPAPEHTSA